MRSRTPGPSGRRRSSDSDRLLRLSAWNQPDCSPAMGGIQRR
jgi:hypothetical protein